MASSFSESSCLLTSVCVANSRLLAGSCKSSSGVGFSVSTVLSSTLASSMTEDSWSELASSDRLRLHGMVMVASCLSRGCFRFGREAFQDLPFAQSCLQGNIKLLSWSCLSWPMQVAYISVIRDVIYGKSFPSSTGINPSNASLESLRRLWDR